MSPSLFGKKWFLILPQPPKKSSLPNIGQVLVTGDLDCAHKVLVPVGVVDCGCCPARAWGGFVNYPNALKFVNPA